MSRAPFPLALVVASCLGAGDAGAIGIGGVRTAVVLGQPLDVTVPVQLVDRETLEAGCVSVDVHVGERRLGPDQVAAAVSRPIGAGQALVRVRSRMGIDEPVVGLTLAAGCPARVTRRFVLFADPPELVAAQGAAPEPPMPAPALPDAEAVAAIPPATASATPSVPMGVEGPASTPLPASARPPARKSRKAKAASAAVAAKPGATPPRRSVLAQAAPRLQLEPMALRSPAEDPRLAAAQAAAHAAEAAASAARHQAADAQAELARLRSATAADREALVTLRAHAAEAEAQAGSMRTLGAALAAMMAAMMVGVAVLSWRLRRRRHEARRAWWAAAPTPSAATPQPGPSTTAPDTDDDARLDPPTHAVQPLLPVKTAESVARHGPVIASMPVSAQPAEVPTAAWVVVPAAPGGLAAVGAATGSPAPAPSAGPVVPEPAAAQRQTLACEWNLDEDADMEQRADFFVVLGLDGDAGDLLRAHLERTGGRSAMACLKLLEIHRRRGDCAAYERTARQFTEHFNVLPPAWEGDADTGRGLDETPHLLAAIERRWHDPREAVDWLESLLWRRTDGAPALPLAAFEDALLLCQVALRRRQPEVAWSEPGIAGADAHAPAMATDGGGLAFEQPWTADEPGEVERFELAFERADGTGAGRAPLVVR